MKTLLTVRCGLFAVMPVLLLPGCIKSQPATQPAPTSKVTAKPQPQAKPQMPPSQEQNPIRASGGGGGGGGNAAAMAVKRGAANQEMRGEFRNIGQFYQQYVSENGSGPRKLDDFLNYIQRDSPAIYKKFKDGIYTLNLQGKPSSNSVIVYETEAWNDGTRNVGMGDGSVTKMNDAELKQALGNR